MTNVAAAHKHSTAKMKMRFRGHEPPHDSIALIMQIYSSQ